MQYLFGFDYEYKMVERVKHPLFSYDQYVTGNAGAQNTFKQVIFPYGQNLLHVRFENIGDNFDKAWGDGVYYVDVKGFA